MTATQADIVADLQRATALLRQQLEQRDAERDAALAREAALAEVLRVINASPGDLAPVFEAILDKAHTLCGATYGSLQLYDGEIFRAVAVHGFSGPMAERLRAGYSAGPNMPQQRLLRGERVAHVADFREIDDPAAQSGVELGGIRTILFVALRKDEVLLGQIVAARLEVRPFSEKEIALVENFAAQCVLAIENARLFETARRAVAASDAALADLRRAQDRLVQSEKMASLGQLTAGIAHEIKNPLNFVNNFSALSAELIDELQEALAPEPLGEKVRTEVNDLTALLKGNLQKVVQHGKRADGIVKNMLLHSRESGGEMRRVDLNATVEEALNLAYHGARAEKPGFNISLIRNFDPAAGAIDLYPQEFTRVLLNLFSNGFYAATRKKAELGDPRFEPTLTVKTETAPGEVSVHIRDNGIGIPDSVRAKMFEPFFTTKPAGEGTGLGLSLSHDIVVKQHGGNITVESRVGEFTEFSVILPRTSA